MRCHSTLRCPSSLASFHALCVASDRIANVRPVFFAVLCSGFLPRYPIRWTTFIMWNRAGSPARRIVGFGPRGAEPKMEETMALEFSICEVSWERYRRVSESPQSREWLKFHAAPVVASTPYGAYGGSRD